MHKIQSQLQSENIAGVDLGEILSEAVFAKNTFLNIHGATPYQAVIGRQPRLLHDFESTSLSAIHDDQNGSTGHSKHAIRLREVAVQSIIEGVAADRAKRALKSKTRIAGEQ